MVWIAQLPHKIHMFINTSRFR